MTKKELLGATLYIIGAITSISNFVVGIIYLISEHILPKYSIIFQLIFGIIVIIGCLLMGRSK